MKMQKSNGPYRKHQLAASKYVIQEGVISSDLQRIIKGLGKERENGREGISSE